MLLQTKDIFVLSFNELAKEVNKIAHEHGFYEKPLSMLERLALIHSEVSEAAEYSRHDDDPQDDHIPEFTGVEAELADVIIRIMDLAEYKKLNVAGAVIAKIAYNKTREYKHGKNC